MDKSLTLALLSREVKGSRPSCRTVDSCAEHCFLQHAVSQYCPLEGTHSSHVKSTIAAAFNPSHTQLVATTHGDHTIKLHHWRDGVLQVLRKGGHNRTPWTVAWHPTDPGLVLTGALDGKVVLWDVHAGEPIQLVETGKTVAACCFHPAGDMGVYCASNKVYMWPVSAEKPWPTLPLRAYKSKHVMRMAMFNPGQPDMLLTGELVGRECNAAQLSHATPAATKAAMRHRQTETHSSSSGSCATSGPAVQQGSLKQQQLGAHLLASHQQQQQQQPAALSGGLTVGHMPPILQQQAEYSVMGDLAAAACAGQVPRCQGFAAAECAQRGLADSAAAAANSSLQGRAAWSSKAVQGTSAAAGADHPAAAAAAAALTTPLDVAAQHNTQQLSMLQLEGSTQTHQHHRQQQQQQQEWQAIQKAPCMQAQTAQQQSLALDKPGQQQQQQQWLPERQGTHTQQACASQGRPQQQQQQQRISQTQGGHNQQVQASQGRSQQQPAEVVLGSSPTTTFFQNLGANFWLGSSRRHAGAAAPTAAAATYQPSPAAAAAAAATYQPSIPVHVDTEQQLLCALRQQMASIPGDEESAFEDDLLHSSSNTVLAVYSQQQHGQFSLQQQQHSDASDTEGFARVLARVGRLQLSLLQLPGFSSRWGLDPSGPDAQLAALCGLPRHHGAPGSATAGPWPIPLLLTQCLLEMNASLGNLRQLGSSSSSSVGSAGDTSQPAVHSCIAAGLAAIYADWSNSSIPRLRDVSSAAAVAAQVLQHEQQQWRQQLSEAPAVPCLATLRVWQLQQQQPASNSSMPQRLSPEQQRLVLPFVVLCSERSVGVSPCGRFLVAVVAVLKSSHHKHVGSSSSSGSAHKQQHQQQDAKLSELDPTKEEFYQLLDYELRVISLEPSTLGEVLAARAVAAAECLTCIQVSPTGEHVLLAYGRRSKQLGCLVPTSEGSFEVWHTVLQVLRLSDLRIVRQLISKDDEVNVAVWHPQPGQGICYGTKAGRVRHILACGSSYAQDAALPCSRNTAAAVREATSVLEQTLQ